MLWYEQSLISTELKRPTSQVSTREFRENESSVTFGDSNDYFYEEKDSPNQKIIIDFTVKIKYNQIY